MRFSRAGWRHSLLFAAMGLMACEPNAVTPDPEPVPVALRISPDSLELNALQDTLELTAEIVDSEGGVTSVTELATWTSLAPSVAAVVRPGVVVSTDSGKTRIVAEHDGFADTVDLQSRQVPAHLLVSSVSLVGVGAGDTLHVLVVDSNGFALEQVLRPQWTSLNPAVAEINPSTGAVTSFRDGQAIMEAAVGDLRGSGVVTVAVPGASPVVAWDTLVPPRPPGVRVLWGASPSELFAARGGELLRWDGSAWSTDHSGVYRILALWGQDTSVVFAGGSDGRILRWTGGVWTVMDTPSGGMVTSFWGASPTDLYATGWAAHPTGVEPVTLMHYDGFVWTVVPGVPENASFNAIWGSDDGQLFAVGWSGVAHFDGAVWSEVDLPTSASLNDVWGTSGNDVLGVGSGGIVVHYDGAVWTTRPTPVSETAEFHAVLGTGTDDVYVAGAEQSRTAQERGVILHWDGATWGREKMVTDAGVYDLAMTPDGRLLAATTHGPLLREDGVWRLHGGGPYPERSSVWGASPSAVFAGGTGVLRYDGDAWRELEGSPDATALWGAGAENVFAIAGGRAHHFDGASWRALPSASEWPLQALWGTGPRAIVGIANERRYLSGGLDVPVGIAARYDGASWSFLTGINTLWSVSVTDVWGTAPDHLFVAGWTPRPFVSPAVGNVYRFQGGAWTGVHEAGIPGVDVALTALTGTSPTDVFAVGRTIESTDLEGTLGLILRYDGTSWVEAAGVPGVIFHDVWASSPYDVFAVGSRIREDAWGDWHSDGVVVRWDGATWSEVVVVPETPLTGVWGTWDGAVFVVGSGGIFRATR